MGAIRASLIGVCIAGAAQAFEPGSLPDAARPTYDAVQEAASLSMPVSTYAEGLPPIEVEGRVRQRAWLIPSPNLPTLRIVQGLRVDLEEGGFTTLLDCVAEACGGFDFRFGLTVLQAPAMNVDLFDFRVLTASRAVAGETEYVHILVSRGRANRFVQLFEVITEPRPQAPVVTEQITLSPAPAIPVAAPPTGLAARLSEAGHVVLPDLDFASGAGALNDRDYPALAALADFLIADPTRRVVLVGHTDAVGSLDANIALSRKRAEAVRDRLVAKYGVAAAQVSAQGAGYLAPVASNLTQAGREANRRVEAVLLAAQ